MDPSNNPSFATRICYHCKNMFIPPYQDKIDFDHEQIICSYCINKSRKIKNIEYIEFFTMIYNDCGDRSSSMNYYRDMIELLDRRIPLAIERTKTFKTSLRKIYLSDDMSTKIESVSYYELPNEVEDLIDKKRLKYVSSLAIEN